MSVLDNSFCLFYHAENEGKLHAYDPTDLEFIRLRHKKHSCFKRLHDKVYRVLFGEKEI